MLMSPSDVEQAKSVFGHQRCALYAAADNTELLSGLDTVETLVEGGRYYEALRKIRSLFEVEQSILTSAEMLLPVAVA
jgi:flagellar biosynthesis repressor protein FlbT